MILVRNAMPQLARRWLHICMHDYISACSGGRAAWMKHNDISAVAAGSPQDESVQLVDVSPARPQPTLRKLSRADGLPLQLQAILLQSAIKRAAAQPERLRRLARIAARARQRFLD